MWLLQWCLLLPILASRAAYYHEPSMTTIQPPVPLRDDSFFGYGISYHRNRLIASAPRADLNGQVFTCSLDKSDTCTQMHVTEFGIRVDHDRNKHKHNFWLGATVKANKRKLFVCAPRSTDNIQYGSKIIDLSETHFGTAGQCFVADDGHINLSKLSQITKEERIINLTRRENATDSFGWSMDVDVDERILRVGSPALAAGRVMTYSDPTTGVIPQVFTSPNKHGFNFGYSIASGYFVRGAKRVAVGTPYGDHGVGKVLIFNNHQSLQSTINDPSEKVGSLFGAALCVAKILWYTCLFVGAPAHFTGDAYHAGIVYMYMQDKKNMKVVKTIEGPTKHGSFFGHAIANVGDVDHDGKDEIVIAAPYEDNGRGAVYLYAGCMLSSKDEKINWIQKFQPETPLFSNFGLSLAANKYTENGCYDLAIGAPANNMVAVYRCLTVITVNLTATFPDLQTRDDKTKFSFETCLTPKFPEKPVDIKAKFTIRVKITHPNATLTNAMDSNDYVEYDEAIDKSKEKFCRDIPVTTSANGDYEDEIKFDITARLLDDPVSSKEFDASKATVSKDSSLSFNESVRAAECKHRPCEPKLKVHLTTNMKTPYVIGSTETEIVEVVVWNEDGDTAYRPCVRVLVEGDATLTRAPAHCEFKDERQRICRLQRPLKSNTSWDVTSEQRLVLDLTSLTSKSKEIKVVAEVYNRCDMEKKADDTKAVNSTLQIESTGVRIDSKTDQGKEVFFNSYDVSNGKIIYHTYTVANTGGTNWVDLVLDIMMYKRPYIIFNSTVEILSGDKRKPCGMSKHSDSPEFIYVACEIGDLPRMKTITVIIAMSTIPRSLEEIFKDSNGTAETSLRIEFDETHKNEKYERSILVPQEAKVPLWIILAAAAVGLLIVLLIAFALYECGFLRRQNKAKLKELQRDVKRKSMMLQRQSMRLSDSARAELRNRTYRELLDEAETKEIEESIDKTAIEPQPEEARNPKAKTEEARNPKASTTAALNGNSSVSNLDIRAQIEKSLQKQTKGTQNTSDKVPLCEEN